MDDTQRTGWQKRILLFLTSQCITLFGSTLVQMALVWYATMQTSSGVWVAAFTVCSYLPQFLISFIGGVWADRYHRKKLIIGADLLIAFVTFVMVLAIPHISSEPALLGGLLVGRLFWNHFTMNHSVVFQIVKLLRKHLWCGVWNQPLQLHIV